MWSLRFEVFRTFAFLRFACFFATDAQIFNVLFWSLRLEVSTTFAFLLYNVVASLVFSPLMHRFLMYYFGRFAWGFSGLLTFGFWLLPRMHEFFSYALSDFALFSFFN